MKALFIQDFRYMLTQKSFLATILLIGTVLALTQDDNYIFVIGYLGFMGMITGMMSVTMDDQNHGLTFLFSLPIDRRTYVREKYLFIVGMGLGFSLLSTVFCLLFRVFADHKAPTEEILATALGVCAVMLLFIAVMLPLTLKYGNERARIVSLIAIGFFIYGPVMLIGVQALDLAPKNAAGTAAGLTGFFGYFLGTAILANIVLGTVADRAGWDWTFVLLIGACLLAILFMAFTYRKEKERDKNR